MLSRGEEGGRSSLDARANSQCSPNQPLAKVRMAIDTEYLAYGLSLDFDPCRPVNFFKLTGQDLADRPVIRQLLRNASMASRGLAGA